MAERDAEGDQSLEVGQANVLRVDSAVRSTIVIVAERNTESAGGIAKQVECGRFTCAAGHQTALIEDRLRLS